MPGPLLIATLLFALLSVVLLVVALVAVQRRRWVGTTTGLLLAALCLALAALSATVSLATHGYRALTHEEVAAVVTTEPTAPDRFRATFRFADGTVRSFELTGDGIYVEAHIVKWHPLANVLGLHTGYQLSRVAGRYERLSDELEKPRTIYPLTAAKPVDMFDLARSLPLLAPLVDAEYGSATFVSTSAPVQIEVRVSTSGLLARPLRPPAAPR